MKLTIKGSGEESPEWPEIEYTIIAEADDYKTTISYWAYADELKILANQLLKFPFDDPRDIQYKAIGVEITIHLKDPAGRTEFMIDTKDGYNQLRFSDLIEIGALKELSDKLKNTNFAKPAELVWISKI